MLLWLPVIMHYLLDSKCGKWGGGQYNISEPHSSGIYYSQFLDMVLFSPYIRWVILTK